MAKNGKILEKLASWIQQCLHDKAKIVANDFLIDKDTKKKRQIDITITLNDGPTKFIAIVEARDRSRPVGVPYIEQVYAKMHSVNANMAIVISSKGFYKTAKTKANLLGIKLFSLEDALRVNWSATFNRLDDIEIHEIISDYVTIYMLEKDSNTIIEFDKKSSLELEKDQSFKIFLDKNMKPFKSLPDIYREVLNKSLFGVIKNTSPKRYNLIMNYISSTPVYFVDILGNVRQLDRLCLSGKFWIKKEQVPVNLKKYIDCESGKTVAEIIDADIGGKSLEIMCTNPDDINTERKIHIGVFNTKPPQN